MAEYFFLAFHGHLCLSHPSTIYKSMFLFFLPVCHMVMIYYMIYYINCMSYLHYCATIVCHVSTTFFVFTIYLILLYNMHPLYAMCPLLYQYPLYTTCQLMLYAVCPLYHVTTPVPLSSLIPLVHCIICIHCIPWVNFLTLLLNFIHNFDIEKHKSHLCDFWIALSMVADLKQTWLCFPLSLSCVCLCFLTCASLQTQLLLFFGSKSFSDLGSHLFLFFLESLLRKYIYAKKLIISPQGMTQKYLSTN